MSIVSSPNVLAQLATQLYAQKATAQASEYARQPVYYNSLPEAKQGAAKWCAALHTSRQH